MAALHGHSAACRRPDCLLLDPAQTRLHCRLSAQVSLTRDSGDPNVPGDRGLNGVLDDWRCGAPPPTGAPRHGTLKWLFHRYEATKAFTRLSDGTKVDYRRFLGLIADVPLTNGAELGDLALESITPRAVDRTYEILSASAEPRGRPRLRQANKSIDVAARAWRKVARLHPTVVPKNNPFEDVTREYTREETKPADRAQAYALAHALAAIGHPSLGLAGIATLPRVGLAMVSSLPAPEVLRGPIRTTTRAPSCDERAEVAVLPEHVTLAGCRHGGMTELSDAEITEQGVMSLSGLIRTPDASRLYVKRTEAQRLAAARRRRAWVDAEQKRGKSRNTAGQAESK